MNKILQANNIVDITTEPNRTEVQFHTLITKPQNSSQRKAAPWVTQIPRSGTHKPKSPPLPDPQLAPTNPKFSTWIARSKAAGIDCWEKRGARWGGSERDRERRTSAVDPPGRLGPGRRSEEPGDYEESRSTRGGMVRVRRARVVMSRHMLETDLWRHLAHHRLRIWQPWNFSPRMAACTHCASHSFRLYLCFSISPFLAVSQLTVWWSCWLVPALEWTDRPLVKWSSP